MEINEWKISAESQLISMDVTCERAKILTRLSQELAGEAITTGKDLSLCRRIADYEFDIAMIKLRMIKKTENRSYPRSLSNDRSGIIEYPNKYRNGQVLD